MSETRNRDRLLLVVSICLLWITLVIIGVSLTLGPTAFRPSWSWLLWSLLIAGIELLPVPAWRGLTISVGFPVLVMVAILYPPGAAGAIALIGALDPREFRREVSLGVALYNRSQVALSVVAASAVFHAFHPAGELLKVTSPGVLVGAAALAALADYAVNAGLVTLYMSIKLDISAAEMFRQLTIGNVRDFLISYLGLGILGLTLAVFVQVVGAPYAVPAFLAPLIFARQMFFRSQALEEAHVELTEREEILRELSNTMAEERADERLQIAGYLHDDLAQVLFRLSLQVDIARKLLDKGDVDDVRQQLDKIRESKQETSDRIRALIRDLHRSPLGAKGLAESLESFTDEVGRDSHIRFHRDVQDIDLPAPIALLVFHIAREGIMNAVKHADPTDVSVTVAEQGEDIVLQLEDNGSGFDAGAPGPEGHYGMAMMRERAKVGGGSLEVRSGIGEGTTITVRAESRISAMPAEGPSSSVRFQADSGAGPFPRTASRRAATASSFRKPASP